MRRGSRHAGTADSLPTTWQKCLCVVTILIPTWAGISPALADEPLVEITGGADVTRHNYAWTVTNRHSSPIVYVEFPHYRADGFTAPDGWTTGKSTFLVNVGVPDRPGVCIAEAPSPFAGISRGRSAKFTMRITAAGAEVGKGSVKVRFADGTEAVIEGVELPRPRSKLAKYLGPLALFLFFAGWIVIRELRRRKRPADQQE